jgi:hypothetical protein
MPVYNVIDNKEDSLLYRMCLNSFTQKQEQQQLEPEAPAPVFSIPSPILPKRRGKKQYDDLQLKLF